jgi:hypothetical protein
MADGDTGAQSGTGTTTQSGGAGSTDSTTSTGSTTDAGTQSGTPAQAATTEDVVSRSDYEAIQNRMKAADQKAARFEQELKALQTKDLPEAEKLKAEHEAAVQQLAKLTETNRKLSLENAFLKDNTHEWQNPAAALKMADLSGVTVNDDGSVTGLKDALKRLANSEAWMLKPKAASEGAAAAGGATPPGSAAVPPMNGRPDGTANAAKGMESRLPALMTRRRPKAT